MKGNPVYGVQPTNRLRDDIFAWVLTLCSRMMEEDFLNKSTGNDVIKRRKFGPPVYWLLGLMTTPQL